MALVVVMLVVGFLTALFFDCCSLLDAGIMALKLNAGVGREVEDVLHSLAVVAVSKLMQRG